MSAGKDSPRRDGTPTGGKSSPRRRADDPRALAISSLVRWRSQGKYSNLEVAAVLSRSELDSRDRAFYTALVYGCVERALTLDYALTALSSRPLDKLDDETRCAAHVGLYQLLYMDRVPDHAAVDATVDAAPRRSRGFVNALLRAFLRAGKKIDLPEDERDRVSVEYSMPRALVDRFADEYPDRYEAIVASTVRRRPTVLRVNTLKTSAAEALGLLGEGARLSQYFGDLIEIEGESEAVLRGIERGLWFVQDASSRAAAHVLCACPGSLVVDCCAAPGGKTFSLAIDMEDRGELRSFDLHENKISLICGGAARLGLTCVHAACRDARECDPALVGRADFVLCDAPCSGFGVISKKPDIKYKDISDAARLPEVQYDILSSASRYVRDGGALVYSTCTLSRAENEGVFGRFLAEHADFVPTDFEALGKKSAGGMLTLFPDEGSFDGFFIARCERRGGAARR